MNLHDEEWEPEPTDPVLLRRVRAAVKGAVSPHDVARLRTLLLDDAVGGAVPHEVRGAVWLMLLGLRREDLMAEDAGDFARAAREAVNDENSREQIEKDVERTRPGLARFKQPAVRGALLRLLSLFCARRGVSYMQGLNELLAPFVLLADTGGNPRVVYSLFSEFLTRFAPWMLDTSESRVFEVLKRAFKYFGRLLLYHDPQLFWLLEREMMTPDLYATSWFVTLFARNFTVETVLALWDLLLLEDNPLGTCFFGLALLLSKREELLAIDPSRLPETLMMLGAKGPDEVRALWKVASDLRETKTPPSFQRLMADRLLHSLGTPTQKALSAARSMQASVCLQATPDDITEGDAQYFTWDCRTKAEYSAGHLAQAAFLPLDELRREGGDRKASEAVERELENVVALCEPLKGTSHICLVGTGVKEDDDMDVNVVALYLTELGFPYVSTLRGGFRAAAAVALDDDSLFSVELVDFNRDAHDAAIARRTLQKIENERYRAEAAAARKLEAELEAQHEAQREAQREAESQASTDGPEFPLGGYMPRQVLDAIGTQSAAVRDGILEGLVGDGDQPHAINRVLNGFGIKLGPLGGTAEQDRADAQPVATQGAPLGSLNTISGEMLQQFGSIVSMGSGSDAQLMRDDSTDSTSSSNFPNSMSHGFAEQLRRSLESRADPSASSGAVIGESDRVVRGAGTIDSSPKPGLRVGSESTVDDATPQKGPRRTPPSFFGGPKSPWGRDAKPGWLSNESLAYPLSSMPKGFCVNVMDDRVMTGLRLFPCRARSDRTSGPRGNKSVEFKRRFVGVSANYFMLLSQHQSRSHMMEVKIIRLLQDIVRITFKRSRPELVTFEILGSPDGDGPNEQLVCIMPEGLHACVELIKEYLDQKEDSDAEQGPDSGEAGASGSPSRLGSTPLSGQAELGRTSKEKSRVSQGLRGDSMDSDPMRKISEMSDGDGRSHSLKEPPFQSFQSADLGDADSDASPNNVKSRMDSRERAS